jgi:hypothetical protein
LKRLKLNIKYVVDGREATLDKFGDAILAESIKSLTKQVKQKASQVVCPEHNEKARVITIKKSGDTLVFSVKGCCQKLIDEVTKALT